MRHYCLKCEPCLAEIRDLRRRIRLARRCLSSLHASPHYRADPNGLVDDSIAVLDLRRSLPKRGRR